MLDLFFWSVESDFFLPCNRIAITSLHVIHNLVSHYCPIILKKNSFLKSYDYNKTVLRWRGFCPNYYNLLHGEGSRVVKKSTKVNI